MKTVPCDFSCVYVSQAFLATHIKIFEEYKHLTLYIYIYYYFIYRYIYMFIQIILSHHLPTTTILKYHFHLHIPEFSPSLFLPPQLNLLVRQRPSARFSEGFYQVREEKISFSRKQWCSKETYCSFMLEKVKWRDL